LTTHLHVVPRSRIREALSPLPEYAFKTWCSVKKSTGRTHWTADRPIARPLHTQDSTTQKKTWTSIYASRGIRTHDPSVRAVEDHTQLRTWGHWGGFPKNVNIQFESLRLEMVFMGTRGFFPGGKAAGAW